VQVAEEWADQVLLQHQVHKELKTHTTILLIIILAAAEAAEEFTADLAAVQAAKVAAAEVHGNNQVDPELAAQEEMQEHPVHMEEVLQEVLEERTLVAAVAAELIRVHKVVLVEVATLLFVIR
jgi:hypothetical protein